MQGKIAKRLIDALKPQGKPFEVVDTELKGFLLRVQPSGVMAYYVSYRHPDTGVRGRYKLGNATHISPVQARDMAVAALADIRKGEDPQGKRREARRLRVEALGDFVEGPYTIKVLALLKSGDQIAARIKRLFKPFWNQRMSAITVSQIEAWRAARVKGGASRATVNRDLGAFKAIFTKAYEWGIIQSNPMARLKSLKEDKDPRVRYLTEDERGRLLDALDAREEAMRRERDNANSWRRERGYPEYEDLRKVPFVDFLRPLVLLAMHTGMRRGELFGLMWEDVDLTRGMLTVKAGQTKTATTRHISLNTEIVGVLAAWRGQSFPTGLVFRSPQTGKRLIDIKTAWGTVRDAAKLGDFRFHDLRHDFASQLAMAGVPLNTIRELLGHGDLKTTLRYAHLCPDTRADAVELLSYRERSRPKVPIDLADRRKKRDAASNEAAPG